MNRTRYWKPGISILSLFIMLMSASCSSFISQGTTGQTQQFGNGAIRWPFDSQRGDWVIENGYDTAPDHFGYEQYSFDFQRASAAQTTGQQVLSPVDGVVVPFGPAFPYDGSSGQCVSIALQTYTGYHLMICHLDHPAPAGPTNRGDLLGTVSGGPNGNHIHITLYFLDPTIAGGDTKQNAGKRVGVAFSEPWTISGCNYPADGSKNQWRNTAVPCTSSPIGGATAPTYTPTPMPTPTTNPLAACLAISGFGGAESPNNIAMQFINPAGGRDPSMPFPPKTIGYVARTFSDPAVGEPGMAYDFQLINVCSSSMTADGIRSFFAAQMPAHSWFRSNTFPYGGDYGRPCGDPFCWSWGAYASDINKFASLENVQQLGSVVTYQVRLGEERPQ